MLHLVGTIALTAWRHMRRHRHTPTHVHVPVTPVHVQIDSGEQNVEHEVGFTGCCFLGKQCFFNRVHSVRT